MPRIGRTVRQVLDPGDPYGPAHLRVVLRASRVRLIVGLLSALVLLGVPGVPFEDRLAMSAVVAGYVLAAAGIDAIAERHLRSSRMIDLVLGMAAIFVAVLFVPEALEVALLAYLMAVTIDTCIAGLRGGVEASVLAFVFALAAQAAAPSQHRVANITLVMFALFLVAVVVSVDTLTKERRRAARDLERLQDALRAVTAAPELAPTLDSVVALARDASGSRMTAVLLCRDEHLELAAPSAANRIFGAPTIEELESVPLRDGGPATVALESGQPVLVGDVTREDRFPEWSRHWARWLHEVNVRSLVCVPLRAGGAAIGVLVACFDDAEAADSDDLGMLQAYADQAALVIVRAQAYEQQRAASEQLHEADRMKSEFLATVSHELRTPLTAAKGFVDTVLLHWDRLSEEQRREMLTRASRNADLLTQQIDLLLDLSRMDSGRLEMIFEDVEIGDLVRETVSALAPVVTERAVCITVPEHLHARVDHAAFVHVLSNLLANAVKFSDPGGRLEIGARREAGEVVVWVEDDGIGVDPAEHERIFERFYQVPSQDRGRGGTGIGLAVVARFVELQEGRVWVESEPGTGSRFSFTVPAVVDVTEAEAEPEGAEEPAVYAE